MVDPRPEKTDSSNQPNGDAGATIRTRTQPTAEQTQWRRPPGVAAGTWRYVHQGAIASRYDAFVADTPLCELDRRVLRDVFGPARDESSKTQADEIGPFREIGPAGEIDRRPRERRPTEPTTDEKDFSERAAGAGGWIIDLGCGTGRAAEELAAMGRDVLAVDLSQSMLQHVVARTAARSPGTITPLRANLVQLDGVADDVADGAVCLFSTLGMIQGRMHRRSVLSHASRIVRPGGTLLLHVHNRYSSLAQAGGWRLLAGGWLKSIVSRQHDFGDATYAYRGLPDMFLHRYSRRELVADLRASGWVIQQTMRLTLDSSAAMEDTVSNQWRLAGGYLVLAKC